MKIFITFTKKTLFCILCVLFLTVLLSSQLVNAKNSTIKNADTHKKRIDFLRNIGCEIENETPKTKEIIIPEKFSLVYDNYNELQKQAGYDLSKFKNEKCIIFSYPVSKFKTLKNDDYASANLIVYNGRIIGGDVSSAKINGKMYPLKL